jgi:hypothetical protein
MKKSLCTVLVILFSFLGAKAFAAKLDIKVEKVAQETSDTSSTGNDGSRKCAKMLDI